MDSEAPVALHAMKMEAGIDEATAVDGGVPLHVVSVYNTHRWLVEFEDGLDASTAAKAPPQAGNFYQLKNSGAGASPGLEGKTPLHTRLRADLKDLFGRAQTSGRLDGNTTPEPEMIYEFATIYHGAAVEMSVELAGAVKELSYVRRVLPDGKVQALDEESNAIIGVPMVQGPLGLTGRGTVIAIVDTGIDREHPAFAGKVFRQGYDFVENDEDPHDDNGHGTHCAGIAAANGEDLKGVAPRADLMAVKVLNSDGGGFQSDVIAGIEFAVDPDEDPETRDGADIINLSLGGFGDPDDPVSEVVDEATRLGVLCVVAAGNGGDHHYSIESPGCAREALTVGATTGPEDLASFSSYGPTNGEALLKPDMVAPGYQIRSSLPGGDFGRKSGTSMATPHVAGAAALLLQQHPDWTPSEIKARLMQSARDLGYGILAQGRGLLDLSKATSLEMALEPAVVSLGQLKSVEPVVSYDLEFCLSNTGTHPQTYYLSGSMPEGIVFEFEEHEVTLNPGDDIEIPVHITVDNEVLPNSPDGLPYTGRILAATMSQNVVSYVSLLKVQSITMNFDETPWFVYIYDNAETGRFIVGPEESTSINVIPGSYDFITAFSDARTYHVVEDFEVPAEGILPSVNIFQSDCLHEISMEYTDENGEPADPESVEQGRLFLHAPQSDYGIIVTSGVFDSIHLNENEYRVDVANAFVTESGDLHAHTHSVEAISSDLDLVSPENIQVAEMQWEGDGFTNGLLQPIVPWISDFFSFYSYWTIHSGNYENVRPVPATWKFISSDSSLEDSPLALKKVLVMSSSSEEQSLVSLNTPVFNMVDSEFLVMADGETVIGRLPVSREPLSFGGAPTVFSGNIEIGQSWLQLGSFGNAPAYFYHPGNASISMHPDGTSSKSTFVLSKDGRPVESGSFQQSQIFPHLRYLDANELGDYCLSLEHRWEEDNRFATHSRFSFEFPGGQPFRPLLPSAIYVVDDLGNPRKTFMADEEPGKIQVYYPDMAATGMSPGTLSIEVTTGNTVHVLQPVRVSTYHWEAPLPVDLPAGQYNLRLSLSFVGGRRAEWNVDPAFEVTPFEIHFTAINLEDQLLPGTLVGELSTSSTGSREEYEFVSGYGDDNNQNFRIEGNRIFVRERYDHFVDPLLSIRIRAEIEGVVKEQVFSLPIEPRDFLVDIPDPALATAIRERIQTTGEAISRMDLLSLESIYLEDVGDWAGLEYAVNIRYLMIRGTTEVDTAVVKQFRRLSNLELNSVHLPDLRWLKDFRYLGDLYIHQSMIDDWTLELENYAEVNLQIIDSDLPEIPELLGEGRIHYLSLGGCPLTSLEGIENFERLYALDIREQPVHSLHPLLSLEGFRTLVLNPGLVDDLDALRLLELATLEMHGFMDTVHAGLLPDSLVDLKLYGGSVIDPSFLSGFMNLYSLTLSDCALEEVPDLSNLLYLESLSLQSNRIMDLSTLVEMNKLTSLNLDSNFLWTLEPLLALPNLSYLSVSDNYLNVDEGSRQLEIIDELVKQRAVVVSYHSQNRIMASAGPDLSADGRESGEATVLLDGSGSLGPVSYHWSWDGGSAEGRQVEVAFPAGTTEVLLTVRDPEGRTATDSVLVDVLFLTASLVTNPLPDYPADGTLVGEIVVPPGDYSDISLELVEGPGDTHNPLFEIQGRQIISRGSFNHYDAPVLSLRIRGILDDFTVEHVLSIPTEPSDFVVNFPDSFLRALVARETGLPPDSITRSVVSTLESLRLTGSWDLTGLEHAIHLVQLDLYECGQLDLQTLSRLHSLQRISISNTEIDNLRWLKSFPNLQHFSLFESTVEDWIFEFDSLNSMHLSIQDCNLENFPEILGRYDVDYLHIRNLPLRSLEGIEALSELYGIYISGIHLDTLDPLLGLESLHQLDVDLGLVDEFEAIGQLDLYGLSVIGFDDAVHAGIVSPNLSRLQLYDGIIRDSSFLTPLTDLQSLTLNDCQLQELPNLSSMQMLRDISLVGNRIDDISGLQNLQTLRYLDLDSNDLWDISPLLSLKELVQVLMRDNYFDLENDPGVLEVIHELKEVRGVNLFYDNQKQIQADAGPDRSVLSTDIEHTPVTLDGSASAGPLSSFAWTWDGGSAEGEIVDVSLPPGTTEITLTVEDPLGRTATDRFIFNAIIFSLEYLSEPVLDYQPAGTVVGRIRTGLNEDDSDLSFELVAGPGDTHNRYFRLEGNELLVAEPFDHFDCPTMNVRIGLQSGSNRVEQFFSFATKASEFAVEIPDPKLRRILPGLTGQAADQITRLKLASIKKLTLQGVLDWQGLQYARNLRELTIEDETILDLEVLQKLTEIESLSVIRADLDDLQWLSWFDKLNFFRIYKSTVEDWVLPAELDPAIDLYIEGCDLPSVGDLQNIEQLEKLYFSLCPELDLNGLEHATSLTDLKLAHMELTEIPDLSRVSSLESLNIPFSRISEINVDHLPPGLENLNMGMGYIWSLEPLLDLPDLQGANLNGNYISLLDDHQAEILDILQNDYGMVVNVGGQNVLLEAVVVSPMKGLARVDGTGTVMLNARDSVGPICDYLWTWDGGQASGARVFTSFPVGVTNISLTVRDPYGREDTATAIVVVSPNIRMPGEGPGAEEWLADQLADLPEDQRSLEADPDGDGFSNLIEYAFVRNPLVFDETPILEIQRNFGYNELSFRYRNDDPALLLQIDLSKDLIEWETVSMKISTEKYRWVVDRSLYKLSGNCLPDGTWEFSLMAPLSGNSTRYYRVKVIRDGDAIEADKANP